MHPTTKLHRETIGQTKRTRRIGHLPTDWRAHQQHRDDVTRPCSCWMCKQPRYRRNHLPDVSKMVSE